LTRDERERLRRAIDRAARARLAERDARPRAASRAEAFLLDALAEGPRPLSELREDAAEVGVSRDALSRAKLSIGAEHFRVGRGWSWRLPGRESG
jgi:hypothetical protein